MHLTLISSSRPVHAVLAVLLLAATVFTAAEHGLWLPMAIGLVGPDVALAFGAGAGLERGQLHPRAVGLYNALHAFWGPLALIAAAPFLGLGSLVAGLAWATHIAVDRAVGYGFRTADGFQR